MTRPDDATPLEVAGEFTKRFGHLVAAPDVIARELAAGREKQQREAERRILALQVPARYETVALETFTFHGTSADRERQGRLLQVARRYLGNWPKVESLLLFDGAPGTGKGHVLWSIAKAIVGAHGASCRVIKLADLIREIRASWRTKDAEGEDRVLKRYRDVAFLVIDEVSRHAFYGQQVTQHLYDVLDYRVEHLRPTVLTSNEPDNGVAEILGPALVNRLQGEGGIVDFGTASWRSRPIVAVA